MNRTTLFILALTLFFSFDVFGQQKDKDGEKKPFDREAFDAKRNAFVIAEVGLTSEEAAEFIPLLDELRRKKFEIGKECRKLSREMEKSDNVSEEDYLKAIDYCLDVAIEEAKLEKEYYQKFKKILSAEKLHKYREAEMKFVREYMRGGGHHKSRGDAPKEKK